MTKTFTHLHTKGPTYGGEKKKKFFSFKTESDNFNINLLQCKNSKN